MDDSAFERFFLAFLNAGIALAIERKGERVERRIIEANTYAAGTGRAQKGIDLIAKVEGGETWVFQCKRHKSWSVSQTTAAVGKATHPAQHYFLLVACDPYKDVQDEMDKHANWSFWNLDRICQEFRMRVPVHKQPQILTFLAPEELKRFAPYATDALVPAKDYFASIQSSGHSFHHRYQFVGRQEEIRQLREFVADPAAKVLKISGKGGDGKSRLLWELAANGCSGADAPEVLFLNPHSSGDLTLALWDIDRPRVVVVDDAHRLERVSNELLGRIREGSATKLVLATRPQGNEALDERLRDHGLSDARHVEVTPLKKKDMVALAIDALGKKLKDRAKELVALTGDSPFLTALAGDLLQRGRLLWGAWHTVEEFRAAVFRSFEADNLEHLGADDRTHGARLLRIVALLAPVTPNASFHEQAAACLGIAKVDVEALLQRLQAAGIVSTERQNVRVIPDLFSDFLVFDTAFDAKRRVPEFARTVLQKFPEQSAAILRNLTEVLWVGSQQAPNRDELLKPLLEAEFAKFDASNFYERSRMVEHWTAFSVFLPEESLALAEKVLTQTTATRGYSSDFQMDPSDDGINTHRYACAGLPSLIKPIALWHDAYRDAALDFLWRMGLETPQGMFDGGKNHPWSVIASVLQFTPKKPVAISEAVLDWISRLVQRPSVKEVIASHRSVLNTLLEPCFDRFVEFSEWQGRTVRWWKQPVNLTVTAPIRERALAILSGMIDDPSWLVALDAIRAVERALHRVAGSEAAHAADKEKFRAQWRPERLKALALLDRALSRHAEVMVLFAIRQLLLRDLAYEEDDEFAKSAREILEKVPDSFELRLATIINTQGYFEFSVDFPRAKRSEMQEKIKELWEMHLGNFATEFVQTKPDTGAAITRLDAMARESELAGHTPRSGELLGAIAEGHPDYAVALADAMLDPRRNDRITAVWQQLLYGLPPSHETQAVRLIALAAEHPRTEMRRGVVDYFRFRNRKEMTLELDERALLERMAAKAGPDEIMSFVNLVQWVGKSCAAWGFDLLGRLPLEGQPVGAHSELLAALNPYHARDVIPPRAVVEYVLNALVEVPEINVDHHGGGYERAAKLYPRVVYEFVLKRAAYYEKLGPKSRFQVLPHDILSRFELPGLEQEADFNEICSLLWDRMRTKSADHMEYVWRELFQGIVLDHPDFWVPRLTAAVDQTTSFDELRNLVEVLHFEGSLVVFRYPDLTWKILRKAEDFDGTKGFERMRASLWVVSGPRSRSYSNGELDKNQDYLEAEAIQAAANHAADPVLGLFFRWIAERERDQREESRKIYQANMAAMDDE
ncbi:ATP-binding protein [Termitidicoccus mucosus]|uniref:ATP-binding protein n=1 Tax=Termitidicoccus mucosus TaxID=1184151 RepID=UPI0011AB6470